MDLVDYLKILQRRWLVVAAAGLVALLVGVITLPIGRAATDEAPKLQVSQYKATTTLLQTASSADTVPLTTLPIFVASGDVPKAAAKALGYKGDPSLLGQQVSVTIDDKTTTVGVTAVSQDPDTAVRTADAFSTALIDYLRHRAQTDIKRKVTLLDGVLARYRQQRDDVIGTSPLAAAQRAAIDDAYPGRAGSRSRPCRCRARPRASTSTCCKTPRRSRWSARAARSSPQARPTAGCDWHSSSAWGCSSAPRSRWASSGSTRDCAGARAFEECLRVPVVASVPCPGPSPQGQARGARRHATAGRHRRGLPVVALVADAAAESARAVRPDE